MISGAKQGIFRKIVQMAWITHCIRENANIGTKYDHAWYQTELVTHFGIFSSKQIAEHDEELFEKICLHFATVSGDRQQISYWSDAVERRARYRLDITMRNAGVSLNYVMGIARHMNLIKGDDDKLEDLPAESILKLNTAVYLYMKRHQKQEVCK